MVDTSADWVAARSLLSLGADDPLAPFALRPDKLFVFSPDGRAAVGYRTALGLMVAGGDPIGDSLSWTEAVAAFAAEAASRSRGIAVLGASERARELWSAHGLTAIPFGRDVVVTASDFSIDNPARRNVRQAVQRSRNFGVEVELVREGDVSAEARREVISLLARARRDGGRGFSMILGHTFNGLAPDSLLAMARDRDGRLVGAHRYLWAGPKDLSLDVPVRALDAPNGVDERLVVETVRWAQDHGVDRVSLSFAPFPELFETKLSGSPLQRWGKSVARRVVHVLDPLIKVEGLTGYLRKFRAFDRQRFVMLRPARVLRTAAALLWLEFFA